MKDHRSSPTGHRHHVVSTAIVMASTLVSRLLGFLRIAVIGAVFGASGQADVLNLVFNIPNNLRKLLAEGALSSAFLPVLTRTHLEDGSGASSQKIVRQLLGLQFALLIPLLLLATIFAQPIVDTILAFPEPERQLLAADLFRFLIHYVLLVSIAAVLMGTLNSHQSFLVPALAPLLFSFAVIGAVLLFHSRWGVFSMVFGVLLGGCGQLLLQIYPVKRRGYSLRPLFSFGDPRFSRILRHWIPVVTTASVFAVDQQVSLFFASGLADGSGSAMTNALVFWQLPFGIFGASITTVLFPLMSRQVAQGDISAAGKTVFGGLRALALLLIPAGVGLALLGRPLIAVALQRGAFSASATHLAARVLVGYSLGLFSVGAFTFLQRFFYALGEYRVPLFVAGATMAVDIFLCLLLKETVLAVTGLAVANSIAFTFGLVLLVLALRSHIEISPLVDLGIAIFKALLASSVAAGTVLTVRWILHLQGLGEWWIEGSSLFALALLCAEALPALAALVLTYRVLGISVLSLLRRNSSAVMEA
ncbi:putative peptidoglycan lipid II flippase [Alkalispirochaeta americana]|uniref:Probable lipid II flippase MurJ n=1 Tax=Alkalispirochaeta americana TaxID=159291 RepID=A0A1N6P7T6_9SPIO|nr:murein biosynthesis integral membrane protein MurJ [Alkalispirochaeta americana]SIQ00424.1 putative peptidoglycan lipid II flippase [Alkalispirochaeta americana]